MSNGPGEKNAGAILTEAHVLAARWRRSHGETYSRMAREWHVTAESLRAATSGRSWRHLTADPAAFVAALAALADGPQE
jgi:hypothetical protein